MRKLFIFLFFLLFSFVKADIVLDGYIHVGDNDDFNGYIPKEPITFDGEHTYNYYLNYPTNFYISKDITITKVELINAQGIESNDDIKVYIDNNLVGTGVEGSNVIDVNVNLKAGFHTISIEGVCYNRRGKKISCSSSRVKDIDDFYFEGYKLYTESEDSDVQNFIQRHHIGDDGVSWFGENDDWYDDLSDNSNKPFWYPDDDEGEEISYDFNINCSVDYIDFYFFRIRDVDFKNKNQIQFYINNNLAGYSYINTNDDGVYDLHFIYSNHINGPFQGKIKIISGSSWGDYDDFSWDEFIVIPHCIANPQQTNSTFNAIDYISDISQCNSINDWDNNITTKLVNKEFNLTILAKNPDTNTPLEANVTKITLYYFDEIDNGECSGNIIATKVICNNCGQTNVNGCLNLDNDNLNINRAVKCVKVNIKGYAFSNTSTDVNESNSTDNFSVRPEKFVITNIPSDIKAGNEFNITIQAVDINGNPVKDYNESVYINGQSVDLEYNETKSNCKTGTLDKISGGMFKDGEANITLKYNEVGDLNLTVKEINGSEFAVVDNDDTNETNRFISQANNTISVGIDHFDLNAEYENYDTDSNFTYYDEDLNISSHLELNISAVDKDNNILENYNKDCYAKDITINIAHNNVDVNVSKIIYKYIDKNGNVFENNISKDENITFIYDKNNFTTDNNGSTSVNIYLNFDRNLSNPVNPFEFEITSIDVNDSDANGSLDLNKKAKYYYGNLLLSDILATENDFNKSYSFIIFDSIGNLKPDGKEVVYNWYENTGHNVIDGNVTNNEIIVSSDYNASNTINGVDVSVESINNGIITFKVSRNDSSVKFAVVHLLSPNLKWLWYSKFNQKYDISNNSTCLNHFCFSITWQNLNSAGEVGSGEFKGTEANMTDTNSTKRGVKIFR
ncbi:hypothetical protein [Nautilia lithotrophica]